MSSRVLGIDPGLQNTGWAIIDHIKHDIFSVTEYGSIKTSAQTDINDRLLFIFKEVSSIVARFSPNSAAIENTYVNSNFNTSLLLSQARAAAIIGATSAGVKIVPYPATTVKKTISGNGKADKAQISKMLQLLLPNFTGTLDKDATDAIALALCHLYHSNRQFC